MGNSSSIQRGHHYGPSLDLQLEKNLDIAANLEDAENCIDASIPDPEENGDGDGTTEGPVTTEGNGLPNDDHFIANNENEKTATIVETSIDKPVTIISNDLPTPILEQKETPLSPEIQRKWVVSPNFHRSLICRFCGGKQCRRENARLQKEGNAIQGLHSSYITTQLIGMQRPSTRLITEHGLHNAFREANIRAIINLQLAGEHSNCGDGIHPHGFSYHPTDLPSVFHYAFGWTDMGIPSLSLVLRCVQVIESHLELEQKVAIHCHAGYGRTGMILSCVLIWCYGMTAAQAIHLVRRRRNGSIQTKHQQAFVYKFEALTYCLRTVCAQPRVDRTSHPMPPSTITSPASPSRHHKSKSICLNINALVDSPPVKGINLSISSSTWDPEIIELLKQDKPLSRSEIKNVWLKSLVKNSLPCLSVNTLSNHIGRQNLAVHGEDVYRYRYSIKLIHCIIDALDAKDIFAYCQENQQNNANGLESQDTEHPSLSNASVNKALEQLLRMESWPIPWIGGGNGNNNHNNCQPSCDAETTRIQHEINQGDFRQLKSPDMCLRPLFHVLFSFLHSLETPLLPILSPSHPLLIPNSELVLQAIVGINAHTFAPIAQWLRKVTQKCREHPVISSAILLSFAFVLLRPQLPLPVQTELPWTSKSSGNPNVPQILPYTALLSLMKGIINNWSAHYSMLVAEELQSKAETRIGVYPLPDSSTKPFEEEKTNNQASVTVESNV